jgi:hypothetical protein
MGTARRLYLYTASLVALVTFGLGIQGLITVVLGRIVDSFGAVISDPGGVTREQTSLAIALVVVGLPIWLIHWTIVERTVRTTATAGPRELRSAARAFHLALVRGVTLAILVVVAIGIASRAIRMALGEEVGTVDVADSISWLVVAAAGWGYHTWVARRDALAGAAVEPGVSWTRLYRYGAALGGILIAMVAASRLITLAITVLLGPASLMGGTSAWHAAIAGAVPAALAGLAVWALHWRDSRMQVGDGSIDAEEHASVLRILVVGALLLLGAVVTGGAVVSALTALGEMSIGVYADGPVPSLIESVIVPPLAALPFLAGAWFHVRSRHAEAALAGGDAADSARRIARHLVALIGLAFLVAGAFQLLGFVLESLLGVRSIVGGDAVAIPASLAEIIVGGAMWAPAWRAILRQRAVAPTTERHARAGRAYLYVVVAVSLISAIGSGVFVLYRLIDAAMGGGGGGLGVEIATPLAALVIAVVVALYHGRLVVGDMRAAPEPAGHMPEERIPVNAAVNSATGPHAPDRPTIPEAAGPRPAPVELPIRLLAPAGMDLSRVVDAIRDGLPPGVTLETD